MYLYYDPAQLGPRFANTNILPPLKEAWSQPQFDAPREFFGGLKLGKAYADLAPLVPEEQSNAYVQQTEGRLIEAFINVKLYHQDHGDVGLRDYTQRELKRCADRVRVVVKRNVFLNQGAASSGGSH